MGAFEKLLEAIEKYAAANAEYKAASEKVRYDRGYFCAREAEAKEAAKLQLKEALDFYVHYVVSMKEVG